MKTNTFFEQVQIKIEVNCYKAFRDNYNGLDPGSDIWIQGSVFTTLVASMNKILLDISEFV